MAQQTTRVFTNSGKTSPTPSRVGMKELSGISGEEYTKKLEQLPSTSRDRRTRGSPCARKNTSIGTSIQTVPHAKSTATTPYTSPRKPLLSAKLVTCSSDVITRPKGFGILEHEHVILTPRQQPPSPRMKKDDYKNRRMSWKSSNRSEERRDISYIAMDEESPNILSSKELKELLKVEEKRQKLLSSLDTSQKCELILDIQCLCSHIVTTVKV